MSTLSKKCSFALLITFGLLGFNVSYAKDASPRFECTLTDQVSADDVVGKAKDIFTHSTPIIYLSCYSPEAYEGEKIKSEWIAADTKNVALPNYKIDEKEVTVTPEMVNAKQGVTANFSLSKPNNGWPLGSYHVDLYIDDELDQSVDFSVK